MFSVQMSSSGVDPWVAAWSSSDHQYRLSRAAAARHTVMEAVRERRHATRPVRHTPVPGRVEPATEPEIVPHDSPAPAEELTPVG